MQWNQMNPPSYGYNCGPQIEFNRQIIGEGDVTSLVYPDGSIQYFFMPISQWWPQMYNNPLNNMNNPTWSPNVAAWLVRSINPQPPPVFSQVRQRTSGVLQKQFYDLEISKSDPTFKLKFHNDGWTSTTDLVYFYPSLRSPSWFTDTQYKGSAAVQVELPPWTICHCEPIRKTYDLSEKEAKTCYDTEHTGDEAVTSMSIDDINSKYDIGANKKPKKYIKKCCCNEIRRKSKKNATCQCSDLPKSNTTNRLVSTFADQASNCLDTNEKPTQTLKSTSRSALKIRSKNDIKPEVWMPKSSFAKKGLKSKSSDKSVPSSCTSDCSCNECN